MNSSRCTFISANFSFFLARASTTNLYARPSTRTANTLRLSRLFRLVGSRLLFLFLYLILFLELREICRFFLAGLLLLLDDFLLRKLITVIRIRICCELYSLNRICLDYS